MFLIGKQSIPINYKDADEFYIYPGCIHINNGITSEIYELNQTLEVAVSSLSADTWYFIMVSAPSDGGLIISETDIDVTDTVPTLDRSKQGYYSADGLSRCIGFFYADATPEIEPFDVVDYSWTFQVVQVTYNGTCSTSFSARTMTHIPLVPITMLATVRMRDPGSLATCYLSSDGTNSTISPIKVGTNVDYKYVNYEMVVDDASKRIWVRNSAGTASLVLYTHGCVIPKTIYNNQ